MVGQMPLCECCRELLTTRYECTICGQERHWLDAPTCEGWWWLKREGRDTEIVRVSVVGAADLWFAYFAGSDEQCDVTRLSARGGRWYGPLTPPE